MCAIAGVPLMLHGGNNIYENSRNLFEGRTDVEGPVRKGYHEIAKIAGGDKSEGNMMYGSIELVMSIHGLMKLSLKPDSWRLFSYVRTDYIRAYKTTPTPILILDRAADAITIDGLHEEWKNQK